MTRIAVLGARSAPRDTGMQRLGSTVISTGGAALLLEIAVETIDLSLNDAQAP
jgi:hypothetical protein